MRTTIDLPDDLFRKAKAVAALRGLKLKDLFASILAQGLVDNSTYKASKQVPNKLPPVMVPGKERTIPTLTNAELFELLDRLDEQIEKRSA